MWGIICFGPVCSVIVLTHTASVVIWLTHLGPLILSWATGEGTQVVVQLIVFKCLHGTVLIAMHKIHRGVCVI